MPTRHNRMAFPRTMNRGILKGRHFDNINEYQQALRYVRKGAPRARAVVAGDQHVFKLTVISGSLEVALTGDPRRTEDVDKALDMLAEFGSK